jgi:predicted Zn-dependent protease
VSTSPNSSRPLPEKFETLHRRMVAKLDGFLDPPTVTLQRYAADDKSVAARYARSVALFELANLDEGLPLIDGLIAEYPRDPYFHELKGQLLFENGRLAPALESYREAVRLLPGAPLLRTSIAHVELETGREDLIDDALDHLREALRVDRFIPLGWRLAGTAYGRKGEMGMASWALAEYNLLIGRKQQAAAMADRAVRLLKEGEPAWLRAQDIKQQTDQKG